MGSLFLLTVGHGPRDTGRGLRGKRQHSDSTSAIVPGSDGDAFWFVRNTALNATNFFSQQQDDLLLEAFRPKTEYHGNVVK